MTKKVNLIDSGLPDRLARDEEIPVRYKVKNAGDEDVHVSGAIDDPNAASKVLLPVWTRETVSPGTTVELSWTFSPSPTGTRGRREFRYPRS